VQAYAFRNHSKYRWPGEGTAFKAVRHLLPNHWLYLNLGISLRYWPADLVAAFDPDAAIERLSVRRMHRNEDVSEFQEDRPHSSVVARRLSAHENASAGGAHTSSSCHGKRRSWLAIRVVGPRLWSWAPVPGRCTAVCGPSAHVTTHHGCMRNPSLEIWTIGLSG